MKNLGVRKTKSVYELTRLVPVRKVEYIGDGKYKSVEIGKEEELLVERGQLRDSFFLARKTTAVKFMWAMVRVRRARVGQLKLL